MFQLDALVIFRVKVHEARCQNIYLFVAMQVAHDTYVYIYTAFSWGYTFHTYMYMYSHTCMYNVALDPLPLLSQCLNLAN